MIGSEGLIIVYGQTPPAWVQAQYIRARKVLAQKRKGIWGALLDGPPSEKQDVGLATENLIMLDCRDGPQRHHIERFIKVLRGEPSMSEFHEVTRPYPGLRPFESWEGEIFFGREEHTNRLLDILQQQRFLATIGPSGSGKSSLVRAGLLPNLPLGSLGTGSDWRIALMRPAIAPFSAWLRH